MSSLSEKSELCALLSSSSALLFALSGSSDSSALLAEDRGHVEATGETGVPGEDADPHGHRVPVGHPEHPAADLERDRGALDRPVRDEHRGADCEARDPADVQRGQRAHEGGHDEERRPGRGVHELQGEIAEDVREAEALDRLIRD